MKDIRFFESSSRRSSNYYSNTRFFIQFFLSTRLTAPDGLILFEKCCKYYTTIMPSWGHTELSTYLKDYVYVVYVWSNYIKKILMQVL